MTYHGLAKSALGVLLSALLLAAAPAERVAEVSITPATATVFVGQQATFVARGVDADGKPLDLPVEWATTGEIGRLDDRGVLTAGPKRAAGTVTITCAGRTAEAAVQVVPYGYGPCHADGRVVYTVSGAHNDSEFDLWMMDGDGSHPRSLTPNAVEPPADYLYLFDTGLHGSWSPDGRRLVYLADAGFGDSAVCTMAADGSDKRVILRGVNQEFGRPSYSPDGTLILLDARPTLDGLPTAAFDIHTAPAAGGELTRLTNDPAPELDACWSPDGRRIVYVKERETPEVPVRELWVMDADGGHQQRLTAESTTDYRTPAWSPDGTQIACMARELGRQWEIGLVAATGGELRLVTTDQIDLKYGPAWSWDGSQLIYATTDDPGLVMELWTIALTPDARPVNLTGRPEDGNRLREYQY